MHGGGWVVILVIGQRALSSAPGAAVWADDAEAVVLEHLLEGGLGNLLHHWSLTMPHTWHSSVTWP